MSLETSKLILDHAARIGSAARLEGIDKSQLENIIASLESFEDERGCLLVAAAYIKRQESRGREKGGGRKKGFPGPETTRAVVSAMEELYRSGLKRKEARQVLRLAKWVYEALQNVRVGRPAQTFEELLPLLGQRGA